MGIPVLSTPAGVTALPALNTAAGTTGLPALPEADTVPEVETGGLADGPVMTVTSSGTSNRPREPNHRGLPGSDRQLRRLQDSSAVPIERSPR